jgi:hypothetical protein
MNPEPDPFDSKKAERGAFAQDDKLRTHWWTSAFPGLRAYAAVESLR